MTVSANTDNQTTLAHGAAAAATLCARCYLFTYSQHLNILQMTVAYVKNRCCFLWFAAGKVEQLGLKYPFRVCLIWANIPWQSAVCPWVVITQLSHKKKKTLDMLLSCSQFALYSSMMCVSTQSSHHMTHAHVHKMLGNKAPFPLVSQEQLNKQGAGACFPAQTESDRTKTKVNMHYLRQQENSSFL